MCRTEEDGAYKSHLLAAQISSSTQYDSAILTISSGMLALSMAFIKDVVQLPTAQFKVGLVSSWVTLCAAIVVTVASFITSQNATRSYYENAIGAGTKWCRITSWLNRISAALFVGGIVLTVVFVSLNI